MYVTHLRSSHHSHADKQSETSHDKVSCDGPVRGELVCLQSKPQNEP